MTTEMIKKLMDSGLTKQQASSAAAEAAMNIFMNMDSKELILEAQRQVTEVKEMVYQLRREYNNTLRKMSELSDTISAISQAEKTYGKITDEKAQTVLALYAGLLNMNHQVGASGDDAIRNASYIMYAYLGGQARKETSHSITE